MLMQLPHPMVGGEMQYITILFKIFKTYFKGKHVKILQNHKKSRHEKQKVLKNAVQYLKISADKRVLKMIITVVPLRKQWVTCQH